MAGLGRLCCLGAEVFGRWSEDPLWLVPALASEPVRGLPEHMHPTALSALLRRWWGILSVAVQRSVARGDLREKGAELVEAPLEPAPHAAYLPVEG